MKIEISDDFLGIILTSILAGFLVLGIAAIYKLKRDYDYLESEVAFKRQAVKESIEEVRKNGIRKF